MFVTFKVFIPKWPRFVSKITNTLLAKVNATASKAKKSFHLPPATFSLRKPAWVFDVARWKRPLVKRYLKNYSVRFLSSSDDVYDKRFWFKISLRKPVFLVWGRWYPSHVRKFAQEYEVSIYHLEDGFMRSIGLGSDHVLPYSLVIDKTGLYFDASHPSDLENILERFDFSKHPTLLERAEHCMQMIRDHGLSKYNTTCSDKASYIYGPKLRKRILVIGQVEDDQSLLYGCRPIMSNADLVRLAYEENPDAQIIYKPHPDILASNRKDITDISNVATLYEALKVPLSLKDALCGVDRVYTLTSLSGFEALIHGVPVTTVGAPFYSGWGVTDDRVRIRRRTKQRSITEIFAATYLLYPQYKNPKNSKKMSLEDVLESFIETLSQQPIIIPEDIVDDTKFFNYATKSRLFSSYLYKSNPQEIAVVSDDLRALDFARGLAARGIAVTSMFSRDMLANDDDIYLSDAEVDKITIVSMHKKYSTPLSKIEADTVKLTRILSADFGEALKTITQDAFPEDVISALQASLEDYIYWEALRFHAAQSSLKDYSYVLLCIDDIEKNIDLVNSYLYHAKMLGQEGKLNIHSFNDENIAKTLIQDPAEPPATGLRASLNAVTVWMVSKTQNQSFVQWPPSKANYHYDMSDIESVKTAFSSFWSDLDRFEDESFNFSTKIGLVCGHVLGLAYAYAPSSLKLLECCSNYFDGPILFLGSALLSSDAQTETSDILLSHGLMNKSTIYNGCPQIYAKKYPPAFYERAAKIKQALCQLYLAKLAQRFSTEFVSIFAHRIDGYLNTLIHQLFFISEIQKIVQHAQFYATAMDRSPFSRMIAAIAKHQKVKSFGIQNQMISISPRCMAPAVDDMGVIDTVQADAYRLLGSRNTLHTIGGVNLGDRLETINLLKSAYSSQISRPKIFFAMQHSCFEEMFWISEALCGICKKYNYDLVIKPHPHQELAVLNKVKKIFKGMSGIKILSKESNTYEELVCCSVIVGIFSNVLLEAALCGFDVIVAAFKNIDPSIDISKRGLALKAQDKEELALYLSDLASHGPYATTLANGRQAFLHDNPQFTPPYTRYLENFVKTCLGVVDEISPTSTTPSASAQKKKPAKVLNEICQI